MKNIITKILCKTNDLYLRYIMRNYLEKLEHFEETGRTETDMSSSLEPLISLLNSYIWAGKNTRAQLQKSGINILPVNYYSNSPSIEDIENSFEYAEGPPPYLDENIFCEKTLRENLEQLMEFSKEFNPPLEGNEEDCKRFYWKNSQFSFSDAMSYYCFIRLIRPATVLEIGSGFSTLVAVEACEKNCSGIVKCIEPYPRKFLKENELICLNAVKAQDITPEFINDTLKDDDILFIDSTHTVKTGSDCLHIYLRVLPKITRNIYVHVHDIFLPFGIPKNWLLDHQIFWTEQYLLLALLTDNPKVTVLYGSAYNSKYNQPIMKELMDNKFPPGGGSLWFRYNGA